MKGYKLSTLKRVLKRSEATIKLYLCRAEFSHIEFRKIEGVPCYVNITDEDVNRLKDLMIKRGKRGKW